MTINKTFEQCYKDKVQTDLSDYFTDRTVISVNDISEIESCDGNTIYSITIHGTGTRLATASNEFIEQQVITQILVPGGDLQDAFKYICNYAKLESVLDNIQNLSALYNFYQNIDTPSVESMPIKLGIYDYYRIILVAKVLYSNATISIQNEVITIGGTELTGLLSYTTNGTPQYEQHTISGYNDPVVVVKSIQNTATVKILYSSTNALHVALNAFANEGSNDSAIKTVTIGSSSYSAIVSVTKTKSATGWHLIDVTFTKVAG